MKSNSPGKIGGVAEITPGYSRKMLGSGIDDLALAARCSLLGVALLSTWLHAGPAPDSIGGKVFHEVGATGVNQWDRSIVLAANGQFNFLISLNGTRVDPTQFRSFTVPIEENGTYTYVRSGDTTATLTLVKSSGGILSTLKLDFSRPAEYLSAGFPGGSIDDGIIAHVGTFWLTDIEPPQPAPMLNSSVLGSVAPGKPLIAGFLIPGAQIRDVLIRVVGPSLAQFGITGFWPDPDFTFSSSTFTYYLGAHYGDWSSPPSPQQGSPATANFQRIFNYVGAFPLVVGSKDAVRVIRLAPGPYTVVCSPKGSDPGGEALIEIYMLP